MKEEYLGSGLVEFTINDIEFDLLRWIKLKDNSKNSVGEVFI